MGEIFGFTAWRQLSQLFAAIAFFHGSEYVLAVAIHGKFNVSLSSLLISKQYVLAMTCSLLEYVIEIVFFPGLKEHWWISNIGLMMVLVGELIRKTAILTAHRAFTHVIRVYYEDHHELVTNGIYSFIRHPGYCGFFIWSVSTQIMLCNPFCTIAFTVVSWKFFSKRIPYEEFFLRQFFGSQYVEYAQKLLPVLWVSEYLIRSRQLSNVTDAREVTGKAMTAVKQQPQGWTLCDQHTPELREGTE